MKSIFTFLAALVLGSSLFAQSQASLDKASGIVRSGRTDVETRQFSTLSNALVDQSGNVVLNSWGRSLKLYNATNSYVYTITLPVPTANRTMAFPIGGGTVVTTPTTLSWRFTGATYNTDLVATQPTVGSAQITIPDLADVDHAMLLSTLTTNAAEAANSVWGVSNGLKFEGATANGSETTVTLTDPTADRTVTVPDGSGTVNLSATATLTAGATPAFVPASSVSAYLLTPAEDETIAATTTGAIAGRVYYIRVLTSGTSSYTLTFGTNFKSTGTLATGTADAKIFVVGFLFDGSNFCEVSRTTAQ